MESGELLSPSSPQSGSLAVELFAGGAEEALVVVLLRLESRADWE